MTDSSYEHILLRAEWQQALFSERLSRRKLRALVPTWPCRPIRVRVHRNHAFEFVSSALAPFLAFSRLAAELSIGDYDDALTLSVSGPSDVEIVWLDYDRYSGTIDQKDLADWLVGRMQVLRSRSDAPILLLDRVGASEAVVGFNQRLREAAEQVAGLRVCPQSGIEAQLKAAYFDDRMVELAGTRVSQAASLQTARALGLRWIPSVVQARLKAVIFDLDHTLWAGVLGEDGIDGVAVTAGHAALQRHAVELASEGIFLGLASKNEDADVVRLFAQRGGELPLSLEHVSARAVSWEPKAQGVRAIIDQLRIGADAVLFVDDNPGELAAVGGSLAGIWTLQASSDAAETLRGLQHHPGLLRWTEDATDRLRAADLAASELRSSQLASATDPTAYLASLRVTLGRMVDPVAHRARLHALSNKTNQFNLALRRFGEAEVDRRLSDPATPVVAISLADRLADSGLVGVLFTRVSGSQLVVEELCVSCRALGRGLDDALVTAALMAVCAAHPAVEQVVFDFSTGPRNAPARSWLAGFVGRPLGAEAGSVSTPWQAQARMSMLSALPIQIEDRET